MEDTVLKLSSGGGLCCPAVGHGGEEDSSGTRTAQSTKWFFNPIGVTA